MAEVIDLSLLKKKYSKVIPIILIVGILILILILNPFVQVDRGECVVIFNKYTGEIEALDPGTHIVWPLIYSKETYPTVTQKYSRITEASTQDLQLIKIEIALNYSLSAKLLADLHQNVGPEYQNIIIKPVLEESIKAATAKFKIAEVIQQRSKLKSIIEQNLELNTKKGILAKKLNIVKKIEVKIPILEKKKKTGKFEKKELNINNPMHIRYAVVPNYFIVENVNIENVSFSKAYEEEVEKKEIQKQRNEVAKARVVETENTRKAQKNLDDAAAYNQKVMSQTATKQSIQLKWIEKWDGKLPVTIMGGDTKALLNLPSK
jgi:regulator of protease activity HflC (stomatin/prohibitin superfamily)